MSARSAARTKTGRRSSSSWMPTHRLDPRQALAAPGQLEHNRLASSSPAEVGPDLAAAARLIEPRPGRPREGRRSPRRGWRRCRSGPGRWERFGGGPSPAWLRTPTTPAAIPTVTTWTASPVGVTVAQGSGRPARRPRGATGGLGEHIVEPCGDGSHADGRELLDGQGRDGGARPEPEQGGQRAERASRRGCLLARARARDPARCRRARRGGSS